MKILFLHGWHSVPGGVKPTYLADHGHTVINPALDDDDFASAVAVAQAEFDKHRPKVVVGSSRGAAVAMSIDSGDAVLVLLCPAWRKFSKTKKTKHRTAILHSRADDVIPFEDSEALVAHSGLAPEALIEVGGDHRLADDKSLGAMLWLCEHVGKRGLLPWLDEGDTGEHEPNAAANAAAENQASYVCDACGETIVIPLDLSEGHEQRYVEDCPVCCNANVIHVSVDADGAAQISVTPEQDQNLD
jgi:Cysteine-rich CPXCG